MTTKPIKGTPFKVVTNDKKETFIVLGNNALLRCKDEKVATQKVLQRDYELLFNLMYFVKNYENKNQGTSKE